MSDTDKPRRTPVCPDQKRLEWEEAQEAKRLWALKTEEEKAAIWAAVGPRAQGKA